MRSLSVILYSDGRPGHEKQSRAVLVALKALTRLSITELVLPEIAGFKRIAQGMKRIIGVTKDDEGASLPSIDLIIGTGSTTHLPMVGLKLRTGAKTVTCMTPDLWLKPWFDLCLVPRHDTPPTGKKYFATFGPPCLPLRSDRHDAQKGLILAGGVDIKSHYWNTGDFISQVKEVMGRGPGISWTLSSSPRTPPDTVSQLRDLAAARDNVRFYSAEDTPKGWIEAAYETHSQVWITADSVSMIYEALTAGCRVGVMPVAWKRPQNKFQNGIADLKSQGLIVDFDLWIQGVELPHLMFSFNEADRCAREILSRWWPDRLA